MATEGVDLSEVWPAVDRGSVGGGASQASRQRDRVCSH